MHDGYGPVAGLVQAADGNFYGTTRRGGANDFCPGVSCGTVFKITPSGTLTTLYSFCSESGCADGDVPFAGLVQAADGNFYGTTALAGPTALLWHGLQNHPKRHADHALQLLLGKRLHGRLRRPSRGLSRPPMGTFTGQREVGPTACRATEVFKITPSGTLTTLHSFDGRTVPPRRRSGPGHRRELLRDNAL